MANVLTKFARRNFGGRRSFSSKLGRAVRFKNPFVNKITLGSMVARPATRLVTLTAMEATDGAILAAAGMMGVGALNAVKAAGRAAANSVRKVLKDSEE
jgi:hypothetical protein